jgi:hypothetical protein
MGDSQLAAERRRNLHHVLGENPANLFAGRSDCKKSNLTVETEEPLWLIFAPYGSGPSWSETFS